MNPSGLPPTSANQSVELQRLRLDNELMETRIDELNAEVERLRFLLRDQVTREADLKIEEMFTAAATPITQLFLQDDLLTRQGKPIQAKDVLAIVRRLVRVFLENGLEAVGDPASQVSYNPGLHFPLSSEPALSEGETVVIRIPGVQYRGKILRKAGVEKEVT
jgi:hypothetical protein